jgi:ketosteroid isomerase-like protein
MGIEISKALAAPLLCIASLALVAVPLHAQGSPEDSEKQVVATVSDVFAALQAEDEGKLTAVVSTDFYLFDNGKRLNERAVFETFRSLHRAGKHFAWRVTQPDVHLKGDTAWIAYVNKGSITTNAVTTEQEWLESAFLQKKSGKWEIEFMQSQRVAPPSER